MTIWDSVARLSRGQRGEFFCPVCADDRQYAVMKWDRYFTLLSIPLFPTKRLAQYVHCDTCHCDYGLHALSRSRAEVLRASVAYGNKGSRQRAVLLHGVLLVFVPEHPRERPTTATDREA